MAKLSHTCCTWLSRLYSIAVNFVDIPREYQGSKYLIGRVMRTGELAVTELLSLELRSCGRPA